MKRSIERLLIWCNNFLHEDKAQSKAQLERVKRKLEKLKRKSRTLKELIEACHCEQDKQALEEELNVATAVRMKAQQKYRELKAELKDKQPKKLTS